MSTAFLGQGFNFSYIPPWFNHIQNSHGLNISNLDAVCLSSQIQIDASNPFSWMLWIVKESNQGDFSQMVHPSIMNEEAASPRREASRINIAIIASIAFTSPLNIHVIVLRIYARAILWIYNLGCLWMVSTMLWGYREIKND